MFRYVIYTKPPTTSQEIITKYNNLHQRCYMIPFDDHRIIINVPDPLVIRSIYKTDYQYGLTQIREDNQVLEQGPSCSAIVQKILSDPNVLNYIHPFTDPKHIKPRFEPEVSKPRMITENCSKIDCPEFKHPTCQGRSILINGTGCCPFYICENEYNVHPSGLALQDSTALGPQKCIDNVNCPYPLMEHFGQPNTSILLILLILLVVPNTSILLILLIFLLLL